MSGLIGLGRFKWYEDSSVIRQHGEAWRYDRTGPQSRIIKTRDIADGERRAELSACESKAPTTELL
jgi:hypothetical protein